MAALQTGMSGITRPRWWHRRLLAIAAGGMILAVPLCYLFLFAAVPAAVFFFASLAAAVALWSGGGSAVHRERLADAVTTGVAFVASGVILTVLANTELYWLWLLLAGALCVESMILAPAWRSRGAVQLGILVVGLFAVPLVVASRRPETVWSAVTRKDSWHVRLLLAGGADSNGGASGPLLEATLGHGADVRLVRLLLSHGADPNARLPGPDNTPLLAAAAAAPAQATALLLDAGADPNAADRSGRTAVFAATHSGNHEMLELLARRGASLDARDASGRTALFEASSPETADRLLRLGTELHATDVRGQSALFGAAARWPPVAHLLLQRGLSVNSRDNRARTPLFELAEGDGPEEWYQPAGSAYRTATWLIASGAERAARDADGKTAADRAAGHGRRALADLIRGEGERRLLHKSHVSPGSAAEPD